MITEITDNIYDEFFSCDTYVSAAKSYADILRILDEAFNQRIEEIQKLNKK